MLPLDGIGLSTADCPGESGVLGNLFWGGLSMKK
jgi:hypothetical protein